MGTKFASYTLKLTSLHEYYQRFLHGSQPTPSGVDMANTVKYFLQSLLCVLKDVEKSPYELLKFQKLDGERMALYPNLDYKQLFNALSQLIDVIPSIHLGAQAFGQTLLQCLTCLLPFLDTDLIDSLSYVTASLIAVLPAELHQDIINYLCFYILPFTIVRKTEDEVENYTSQSISAVIMMIFEYSCSCAHHCQLLECLMALKPGVVKDILCVIAYGTTCAKSSAAKLLFYYWPTFNANLFDRRSLLMKFSNDFAAFVCQRDDCPNAGNAEAAKVCYNHFISITFASDLPPPIYLCIECANEIHRDHPNQMFHDILHPMQQVSLVCENKNCRASDKLAISVCFSTECASYNSNHPIRYCQQCHNIRHNNRRGGDHIFHTALCHISEMDPQSQTYTIQAIISLLKEAESVVADANKDLSEMYSSKSNTVNTTGCRISNRTEHNESTTLEERQLLGRYGVWLLVGLCTPDKELSTDVLGRLLSMLFHWFHVTAYSFDGTKKSLVHLIFSVGQAESTLEKLKTEHICPWLFEVIKKHYNVFVSCLLPHPPDYVRVGGHWETLASRTSHLKDGLDRLFCLVPYEIITCEIWDYVMPYWMEAIVNDVPIQELQELKITLCKILDPDMSPLGFDTKKMYNFVAKRFINTNSKIQEQALNWLQKLTMLEITIPLSQLFSMFNNGISDKDSITTVRDDGSNSKSDINQVDSIEEPLIYRLDEAISEKSSPISDDIPIIKDIRFTTDEELNLSCYILMLDILLKQMELQNVEKHIGIHSWVCRDICHLLRSTKVAHWSTSHNCSNIAECSFCESTVIWHQLCLKLLAYIAPAKLAHPPDSSDEKFPEGPERKSPADGAKKSDSKPDVVINMPIPESHSVGGVLVHMPHFFEQIMTATVETVSEQLDLGTMMPSEKIISAVARAVTLSETDVATAMVNVDKPNIMGADDEEEIESDNSMENFWQTSIGKFRFCIKDLPEQLQYIYKLFKELVIVNNPDILCYMLECLNVMCLYGDILNMAAKEHQGFFIWCQENLFIKNSWQLLNAEHSHVAQMVVPLLLHCVSLTYGIDTFWQIVQTDFHNTDWRIRFTAVERVTLVARFMDSTPLKNASALQASLATVFCYLINSMDDSDVYVAQKATLYLGTIHDTAMKALLMCMETQFDSIIIDRPIILQSLYQLHNCLCDRRILTWDFFLNRFDTLFLEAQINLEKMGDVNYFRDLKNTDCGNEAFVKKLQKAHEALSQNECNTDSTKTLSASFGAKWPYKRSMSGSASGVSKQDSKQEKAFNRQYYAPILKRKSSRFGLGQLIGYTLPNNSIAEVHVPSLSTAEDGNSSSFSQKIVELEEADKETIHLLVFLFMQFLSRPDQAYTSDEKLLSKTQGIVLRHLYLLLGYNQVEKNFFMSSQKLRLSPVFNVFLTNLPQVLDQNHSIGLLMIQPVLAILQHSPRPPQKNVIGDNFFPSYSLWYLESYCRRSWLMSLLVILYKYEYGQQYWCGTLQELIKIVLHTLDRQYHKCKHIPTTVIIPDVPSRSRDVSQPSLGVEHEANSTSFDDLEQHSPPLRSNLLNKSNISTHSSHVVETHPEETQTIQRRLNKLSGYSSNTEDTESELAAIPESPKSDNYLQDSSSDSFQKVSHDTTTISDEFPTFAFKEYKDENQRTHEKKENIMLEQSDGLEHDQTHITSEKAAEVSKPYNPLQNLKTKLRDTDDKLSMKTDEKYDSSFTRDSNQQTSSTLGTYIPMTVPAMERLLPVGSNLRNVHKEDNKTLTSDPSTSQTISVLEIPMQERLLPIGLQKTPFSNIIDQGSQVLEIINLTDSIKLHTTSLQNYFFKENPRINNKNPKKTAYLQFLSPENDDPEIHKVTTPRKLTKQSAIESPPFLLHPEHDCNFTLEDGYKIAKKHYEKSENGQDKKSASETGGSKTKDIRIGYGFNMESEMDDVFQTCHADFNLKQSSFRVGEDCIYTRCSECGLMKEEYTDEDLGLCIIILGTFIHREPSIAAPFLPEILNTVTNITLNVMYPWQSESTIYLPGGAISVAHQFLRCVLHQMAPNGIFMQMFQTNIKGTTSSKFFRSVAQALVDFNELNPIAPLQILLENLNAKKSLPAEHMPTILYNIGCYLDCLPLEAGLGPGSTTWSGLIVQFDGLFRRLVLLLPVLDDMAPLLKIMICILKVPGIQQSKGMLDPFSKILSYAIQNSIICYNSLVELCYLCHRNFTKERDKHFLSRTAVFELMQAIKFKSTLPDINLLLLLQFVLQDAGGVLLSTIDNKNTNALITSLYNTNSSEPLKNQITDIIDFIMDIHTSSKIKSYSFGLQRGFNEDTLSGILKCGLAQFLALEFSKGNSRENRAISRYLSWLYTAPSTVPQGAREYLDCINHIRLLSWILLGSLTHTIAAARSTQSHGLPIPNAQPVPQEASCHIADHIQVILSAFPDQYKSSIVNISSLFHAFNLCQLWTLYLEEYSKNNNLNAENHNITASILLEFWGKVTPTILQLVSHSKSFADMVNLHFLSLLETLLECDCTILNKLLPMWNLIIFSHHVQMPGHIYSRLQQHRKTSLFSHSATYLNDQEANINFLQCLRRLQFRMGQIELQSSNTTQFYPL